MQNIKEKLFSTQEGRILLFGVILILLLTLFIIITYFINSSFANKISGMVVTNIAVGRVPSLSLGYATELSHFVVIFTNLYVEMIMVTIIYPLFVFSFNRILKVRLLEDFFNKVQVYKAKHQLLFDKYGIFGLFIFVFFPFWMTGPIVGSLIGYLLGVKHYTTIAIVAVATAIAMIIWGIFLHEFIELLSMIDTALVWIFLMLILAVFLLIRLRKES